MVFQLGEVEEQRRQQAPILLPPTLCPVDGHGDQGVDELLVHAVVVSGQAAQPLLAHSRQGRLDVSDLSGAHTQQSRRLTGGEACGLSEPAQLGRQAHLTCPRLTPQGH